MALLMEFKDDGKVAYLLDSEVVREIRGNRDFSDSGRRRHLMYLADCAADVESKGQVAIVTAICPSRELRDEMRSRWKESRLVYIPGGKLWEGTTYERPQDDEY